MTDLFAKYDVPVPRYTSYPTAPAWHDTPTTDQWTQSLTKAVARPDATLSLYVHLPFCESLCTFCGCNTVITRDHGRSGPYVDLALRELDAYLERVPALADRPVCQLHLGGGTPTFLAPEELAALIDGVFSRLQRATDKFEGSVEADPRVTTAGHLDTLRARGFTRLSLGIQDFNDETQRLVNRVQSESLVTGLVALARSAGYDSINFDLIYGLPGQTVESMGRTADQVIRLSPDRLAIYSFARVPWIKPQQRKFRDDQIPAGAQKRALYETIRRPLLERGYVELGMDHFAKPEDGLARAAAAGTMHRNFQGYTERRTTTLIGLGVSAISETPDCYHQNEKVITVYDRRLQHGEIPTLRGHRLSADDMRRREKILSLMTSFRVALDPAEAADARVFLEALVSDGLVEISDNELRIPTRGRAFLRNAAAFFDRHLRTTQPSGPMYLASRMSTVSVIGAGLSGLSTAWYLAEAGARVRVIEASRRPGGLIQTSRVPDGLVEEAARAFTWSDRTAALFRAMDVPPCFEHEHSKRRYIFRDGRPRRWPLTPFETVRTAARFGAAFATRRAKPRADESVAVWGQRVIGAAATRWLIAPALQGIYATSPDALSARAIFGKKRGPRAKLAAPPLGMGELIARLHGALESRGVTFEFGQRITDVDLSAPTAICTGAPVAAQLLRRCAPALSQALGRIRMTSLVAVTSFFEPHESDLRGFGILFPRGSGIDALGVMFNAEMFPGRSTLRSETWIYGSLSAESLPRHDEDAVARVMADRRLLTGRHATPHSSYVANQFQALPVYDTAVTEAQAALTTLPRSVALAGNYLGWLGVSHLLDGAAAAAARLTGEGRAA